MVDHGLTMQARGVSEPPRLAVSVNGQIISMYHADRSFRDLVNQADVLDADGMSVVFAARLRSRAGLPERVATTDFFHDVAELAQEVGLRFYFIGATEDQNARAVQSVRRLYPNLMIAGRRDGFFKPEEEAEICREIVAAGTDILWVGMGAPRQEAFAVRNRHRLQGVSWVKTCGGLFDFLSGQRRRAPSWMQRCGLEFVFRTLLEPKRLFWRYVTTSPQALYHMALKTRDLSPSEMTK